MIALFSLLLLSVIAMVPYATAQTPGEVTETVILEQMSHEVINGTFVVKSVPVEATVTRQIVLGGESGGEPLPWHIRNDIRNGYDSKILPLLQEEIDTGMMQCITDSGAGTCPVPKNGDGRSTYHVTIVLEEVPMWA